MKRMIQATSWSTTWLWDDVTGALLDPRKVERALLKEIEYNRSKGVHSKIHRVEASRRGICILRTRWIDVNEGGSIDPNHRSLFAQNMDVLCLFWRHCRC